MEFMQPNGHMQGKKNVNNYETMESIPKLERNKFQMEQKSLIPNGSILLNEKLTRQSKNLRLGK
jgi:hypothetical protein